MAQGSRWRKGRLEASLVGAEQSSQSEAKVVAEFLRELLAETPGRGGLELAVSSLAEMRGWIQHLESEARRELGWDPSSQAVLVSGNLSDGFRAYGPFEDHNDASEAADRLPMVGSWVMGLEPAPRGAAAKAT